MKLESITIEFQPRGDWHVWWGLEKSHRSRDFYFNFGPFYFNVFWF